MSDDAPSPPARQGTILSTGYTGLLLTQFLGAFNDNMFRWLVVPIGQQILPSENAATLSLALGGICFTIPYLILVATAGSLEANWNSTFSTALPSSVSPRAWSATLCPASESFDVAGVTSMRSTFWQAVASTTSAAVVRNFFMVGVLPARRGTSVVVM